MQIKNRLESIDALRGFVMILMALDHVRDYFGDATFDYAAGELKTNGFLFFTRWITNLCAPTFIFLVGVSMYLALNAGKSKKELSMFLVTRGLWLMLVDFFVMHFAWTFTFDFSLIEFDVLTVTGASMIVLAFLIFLPRYLIFGLCAGVLLGHNLLDGQEAQWLNGLSWLHSPAFFTTSFFQQQIKIYPYYVMIPWVVVPGLGYLFGPIFDLPAPERARRLIMLGTMCVAAFFILRGINVYGDPQAWVALPSTLATIFSFLNVTKYPPSLSYFLINLGLAFYILCLLDHYQNKFTGILAVYGKTPFAFYVLHIFVIHALAMMLAYINFGSTAMKAYVDVNFISFDPALSDLTPYGYSLLTNYIIWMGVILLFYPFCKWYGDFKRRHRNVVLLSYL